MPKNKPPSEIKITQSAEQVSLQPDASSSSKQDFHTIVTPSDIELTDFNDEDYNASFWNIAPRWTSTTTREWFSHWHHDHHHDYHDDDCTSVQEREIFVVPAIDTDEEYASVVDNSSHAATMESNRQRLVQSLCTAALLLILVTGLIVLTTTSVSTKHHHISIGDDVTLFQRFKYSHRYTVMKERLIHVSDVAALEDLYSPQYRALRFLVQEDPLVLVSLIFLTTTM